MGNASLPPPNRPRRPRKPLAKAAGRPRPTLPRLPQGLPARDLAYASWFITAEGDYCRIAITPDELSTDDRGRLLERAETRYRRLRAIERQEHNDRFWLGAELRLVVPRLHLKAVQRWREQLRQAREWAEWRLDQWRQAEAFVLQHEPATDAWLRRQLEGLAQDGPR
jgi:hypothetical protein